MDFEGYDDFDTSAGDVNVPGSEMSEEELMAPHVPWWMSRYEKAPSGIDSQEKTQLGSKPYSHHAEGGMFGDWITGRDGLGRPNSFTRGLRIVKDYDSDKYELLAKDGQVLSSSKEHEALQKYAENHINAEINEYPKDHYAEGGMFGTAGIAAVKSVYGDALKFNEGSLATGVVDGRALQIKSHGDALQIDFGKSELMGTGQHAATSYKGDKGSSLFQSLQFLEKLEALIAGAGEQGLGIKYNSEDERLVGLYEKALSRKGFKKLADGHWVPHLASGGAFDDMETEFGNLSDLDFSLMASSGFPMQEGLTIDASGAVKAGHTATHGAGPISGTMQGGIPKADWDKINIHHAVTLVENEGGWDEKYLSKDQIKRQRTEINDEQIQALFQATGEPLSVIQQYLRSAKKIVGDRAMFADVDTSKMSHHAEGGRHDMTRGGPMPNTGAAASGQDWHPAYLTDKEYVIRADRAVKFKDTLDKINFGTQDHFAFGGSFFLPYMARHAAGMMQATGMTNPVGAHGPQNVGRALAIQSGLETLGGPIGMSVVIGAQLIGDAEQKFHDALVGGAESAMTFSAKMSSVKFRPEDMLRDVGSSIVYGGDKLSKNLNGPVLNALGLDIIPQLKIASGVIGTVVSGIGSISDAISGYGDKYGDINAGVASAKAQVEVQQTMGDMRRAATSSEDLAKYIVAQGETQAKFEDMKIRILTKLLPLVTDGLKIAENLMPLAELVVSILKLPAEAVLTIVKILSEMLNIFRKAEEEPGEQRDQTDWVLRTRFPGWSPP